VRLARRGVAVPGSDSRNARRCHRLPGRRPHRLRYEPARDMLSIGRSDAGRLLGDSGAVRRRAGDRVGAVGFGGGGRRPPAVMIDSAAMMHGSAAVLNGGVMAVLCAGTTRIGCYQTQPGGVDTTGDRQGEGLHACQQRVAGRRAQLPTAARRLWVKRAHRNDGAESEDPNKQGSRSSAGAPFLRRPAAPSAGSPSTPRLGRRRGLVVPVKRRGTFPPVGRSVLAGGTWKRLAVW